MVAGVICSCTGREADEQQAEKVPPRESAPATDRTAGIFTSHSAPVVQPGPHHPASVLEDEIDERVARGGPQEAAEEIRRSPGGARDRQLAAMEAVVTRWAETDPAGAWSYVADQLGPATDATRAADHFLWQAGISGYIGGVALTDPETAASASEYLDRRLVVATDDPAPPGDRSVSGRRYVWERGWVASSDE